MVAPLPTPSAPSARVPEGVRLALAAAAAAVLVLAILVLATARTGAGVDSETAAGGLSSSSDGAGGSLNRPSPVEPPASEADESGEEAAAGDESGDSPPVAEPAGGCPAGTVVEVCNAVAFIEAFKGDRPFKTFPTVNFIDGEAFDEFVLDGFDEGVDALRESGDVLASLGLIEPDVDLAEALRTTLELGVVGAYNTETAELNINGTEVNLYTQMVMVHELTHAWDDQYFELRRPEYDDADGEVASGFLNVVEGSATLTENAWRASLTGEQRSELDRLELGAVSPEDMDLLFAVPFFVLQLQVSPYIDGAAFVQAIYDRQGMDGVDALFDAPPTTTEQVFDVEAYLDEEPAAFVDILEPPTTPFDTGVLGELTFRLWFGDDVAAGWGGDRYHSWREGDTTCTMVSVTGDTETDTEEFLAAFDDWRSQAPSGATREVQTREESVIATGCR